jgi:two-component system response regulator HydG
MSKRILIIDDEEFLLDIWKEQFLFGGFEVTTASSGKLAVDILKSSDDFDIVLTDLKMPQSDGIVVLNYLKENGIKVPTFVCSGFIENLDNILDKYHITKVIQKPFELNEAFEDIIKLSNLN